MTSKSAIDHISRHLDLSTVAVSINLPYEKVVYDLDEKSANAIRIQRFRAKKKTRR